MEALDAMQDRTLKTVQEPRVYLVGRLPAVAPGRHRVRLSSEGRDDLIRELDMAGESLAFDGALPHRQASSPPAPLAPILGLVVVLALLLGLWLRSVARQPKELVDRAPTPSFPGQRSDPGTDESFPMPFGEYFPVPRFVRSWLRLMSLPYADFTAGIEGQHPLRAAGLLWAPTICYEDAFGNDQRSLVGRSAALVNVTNDAWFGHSPARYQHLQIARMRALESRRELLRAANDGVSALIGADGELRATAPEYQPAVLRGTVQGRSGQTPYTAHGDWPLVLLGLLAAGAAAAVRMRPGRQPGREQRRP